MIILRLLQWAELLQNLGLQSFHLTSTSVSPLFHTESWFLWVQKIIAIKISIAAHFIYLTTHRGQSHNNSINTIMMHVIIEES